MSLKNLSTSSMVSVSSPWVDPARDRPLLAGFKSLNGLLPLLDDAHQNLLATQPSSAAPPELAAIQKQEAEADALHDRKVRGIHNLLTSLADLTDDHAQAAIFLDLRGHLFPDGLDANQQSYAAEAGNTAMVDARLTALDRGYLASIPVLGQSLGTQVEAWKKAGATLGDLERQRSQLPASTGTSKAQAAQARNGWIRVVNAVVANASLEPDLDEAKHLKLFGLLERLSAAAERRTPAGEANPAESGANSAAKPAAAGK